MFSQNLKLPTLFSGAIEVLSGLANIASKDDRSNAFGFRIIVGSEIRRFYTFSKIFKKLRCKKNFTKFEVLKVITVCSQGTFRKFIKFLISTAQCLLLS